MEEYIGLGDLYEITTFLLGILVGAVLCMVYDCFRILRIAIRHKTAAVFAEDILYWFLLTFTVFIFLLIRCRGQLRAFALLGISLGWLGWFRLSSRRYPVVLGTLLRRLICKMKRPISAAENALRRAFSHLILFKNGISDKITLFLRKK